MLIRENPSILKLLALVTAISLLCTVLFWLFGPFYLQDIGIYWKSASLFVSGQNPYILPHYSTYLTNNPNQVANATSSPNIVVFTNPLSFLLVAPLGFLDLDAAKLVYLFGSFFSFAICNLIGIGLFPVKPVKMGAFFKSFDLVMLFIAIPFGLFYSMLSWGAPSWLGMSGISGFLWAYSRKKFLLSGVLLSLACFKLHLVALVLTAVVCAAVKFKNYRVIKGLVMAEGVLLTGLLIFRPEIFSQYIGSLNFATNGALPAYEVLSASFASLLFAPTAPSDSWKLFIPILVAMIATSVLIFRATKPVDLIKTITLIVPFSIVLAPYAWGHDYLACLPLLYLARQTAYQNQTRKFANFGAIALSNGMALWCAIPFDRAPWVFIAPGLGLAAVAVLSWRTMSS